MTIPEAETALRNALQRARTERTQDALTAVALARRALRKAHEAARVDVLPDGDALQQAVMLAASHRAAGSRDVADALLHGAVCEWWTARGWTLKRGKWIAPKRARKGDAK